MKKFLLFVCSLPCQLPASKLPSLTKETDQNDLFKLNLYYGSINKSFLRAEQVNNFSRSIVPVTQNHGRRLEEYLYTYIQEMCRTRTRISYGVKGWLVGWLVSCFSLQATNYIKQIVCQFQLVTAAKVCKSTSENIKYYKESYLLFYNYTGDCHFPHSFCTSYFSL